MKTAAAIVRQEGLPATASTRRCIWMPMVKAVELLCGIAFVAGRFVALANAFVAYQHRESYAPLLRA